MSDPQELTPTELAIINRSADADTAAILAACPDLPEADFVAIISDVLDAITVQIRAATLNIDDSDALAAAHSAAVDEAIATRFGRAALRRAQRARTRATR